MALAAAAECRALGGMSVSLRVLLALLGAVAISASSSAEPCSAAAEGKLPLSGEKPDTISVSVSGETCSTATLVVRIASVSGSILYERSAPFSHFHSVSGDPPYIEEPSVSSAQRIVREIASSQVRKVADLLPYFEGEQDDGITIRKFVLAKPEVLRLRQQPRFTLSTGWEAWSELAFDPESSRVIVVAEGWL